MERRIVAIEDSKETVKQLVELLQDAELKWIGSPPFFDAKIEASIKRFDPDLIILDLLLDKDKESGFRVLRELKSSELLKKIPVVVCSKFIKQRDPGDKNKERALALGAELAISKIPFPKLGVLLAPSRHRD